MLQRRRAEPASGQGLDREDRHGLETAWAGKAKALVTIDFDGFVSADFSVRAPGRSATLTRGGHDLCLVHPFRFASWIRGEQVDGLDLD